MTFLYGKPSRIRKHLLGCILSLIPLLSGCGKKDATSPLPTAPDINIAPVAMGSVGAPVGCDSATVTFYSAGADTDGTIVLYQWDFENDGQIDWSSPHADIAYHTYTAGSYRAKHIVTDNQGKLGLNVVSFRVDAPETVFVSVGTGSSGAPGTSAAPLSRISDGLTRAVSIGPCAMVIVAVGTYPESPQFKPDLDVRGGYDPSSWTRRPGIYSQVGGSHIAVTARAIGVTTRISGFEFIAENALSLGESSIGFFAEDCDDHLQFEDCRFVAGDGATGRPGENGSPGRLLCHDDGKSAIGGLGGEGGGRGQDFCGIPGGDGGNGGGGNGQTGSDGRVTSFSPTPAKGGKGGAAAFSPCPGLGGDGEPGQAGADGQDGPPGGLPSVPHGAVAPGNWRTSAGAPGGAGRQGNGGAGGGGGGSGVDGNCLSSWAAGGGGGGTGNTGGGGGIPGSGGGASIAIALYRSNPRFESCEFRTGQGGRGGDGGNGAAGWSGGRGGLPGSRSTYGGRGGAGGKGGRGGNGGGASGSAGGVSWGIARDGMLTPTLTNCSFHLGVGGIGGNGGYNGNMTTQAPSGIDGTSLEMGP